MSNTGKDFHVVIIGPGRLGTGVADMLMRRPDSPRLTILGTDIERTRRRANLSLHTATQLGYRPEVATGRCDLLDTERTAEQLATLKPDLIFSTASLQAWWVIGELPPDIFRDLDRADIGPWLPMQLTLIHKLMRAVAATGHNPLVVNAALPDVTHAMLDKVGLAPTIGVGNVANVVPGLRRAAADLLRLPIDSVDLRLVAEAFVSHTLKDTTDVRGAPYHLRVLVDGREVAVEVDQLVALLSSRYARIGGGDGSPLTAASAVTVIDALIGDRGDLVHAPGPGGRIGGYPVRVWRDHHELALPPSVSVEQAEAANAAAMVFDGIAEIRDDGSAVYTPENMAILTRLFGYSATSVTLEESEAQARELAGAYAAFRRRVGARTG